MAAELNNPIGVIERTMVGGAQVARLDLEQTARLIVNLARGAETSSPPLLPHIGEWRSFGAAPPRRGFRRD